MNLPEGATFVDQRQSNNRRVPLFMIDDERRFDYKEELLVTKLLMFVTYDLTIAEVNWKTGN
jgi:hypothetical protein